MGVMESLTSGFSSFFFDMVVWVIVVCAGCFFAYKWYINKVLYKYTFIEWYDEKNFKIMKGKLVTTKKGVKKFMIKGYNDPTTHLQVTQPNGFINGSPCRHVCWDGMGNLAYMKGVELDKTEYLKTALTPVERTEAIDAQMESTEKGLSMTTLGKWAIGTITIIVVFLMVTIVMVAKYGFEQSSSFTQATSNMITISENQKSTQQITKENTIAMNNLASAYAKMFNLTIIQEFDTS